MGSELKYTQSHEWIRVEQNVGTVGITEYAKKELGEIVYVQLPAVGRQVRAGEEVAVLESTKAAADIYTPVSGEIVEVNPQLCSQLQLLNTSAQKEGWLFKIRLSDPKELETLLSQDAYAKMSSSCAKNT